MTFLSRLVLSPRSRDVRRDLRDCYQLHRTVMSGFPHVDAPRARAECGVLHRLEFSRRGQATLLVQSAIEPDWGQLPDGYAADAPANPAVKQVGALYEDVVRPNAVFRFRLVANPTRKIPSFDSEGRRKKNGTRVPIRDETARLGWLQRKADAGGFEVLTTELGLASQASVQQLDQPSHGSRKSGDRVTAEGVEYQGRIRIVDELKFLATLRNGIGSGKAYGFGLVSIAR